MPVSLTLDFDAPATPVLRRLRDQFERAREASTYRRDVVARVPELRAKRQRQGAPVFDLVVAVDNPDASLDLPSEASLLVAVDPSGTSCRWVFDRQALDATFVNQMQRQWQHVIDQAQQEGSETPFRDITLLTPADRQTLLVEWNDTAQDYERERGVHEFFEAQAPARRRRPPSSSRKTR